MDICIEGKDGCWKLIRRTNGELVHSYCKLSTAIKKAKEFGGKVFVKDLKKNPTWVEM